MPSFGCVLTGIVWCRLWCVAFPSLVGLYMFTLAPVFEILVLLSLCVHSMNLVGVFTYLLQNLGRSCVERPCSECDLLEADLFAISLLMEPYLWCV